MNEAAKKLGKIFACMPHQPGPCVRCELERLTKEAISDARRDEFVTTIIALFSVDLTLEQRKQYIRMRANELAVTLPLKGPFL